MADCAFTACWGSGGVHKNTGSTSQSSFSHYWHMESSDPVILTKARTHTYPQSGQAGACVEMLQDEHSSPALLPTRRDTEKRDVVSVMDGRTGRHVRVRASSPFRTLASTCDDYLTVNIQLHRIHVSCVSLQRNTRRKKTQKKEVTHTPTHTHTEEDSHTCVQRLARATQKAQEKTIALKTESFTNKGERERCPQKPLETNNFSESIIRFIISPSLAFSTCATAPFATWRRRSPSLQ